MQQMMGLNNFVYKTGQIDSPKRWKYSKKSIKKIFLNDNYQNVIFS